MKQLKWIFCSLALAFLIASCGGNHSHNHDHGDHHHGTAADSAAVHGHGKEFTSVYVCPMHCQGSGSASPGTCPVCGMDYVQLGEHIKDGHTHKQ